MNEDIGSEDVAGPDILNRSVDGLNLSSASAATLRGYYIQTVGELVQKMEGELLSLGLPTCPTLATQAVGPRLTALMAHGQHIVTQNRRNE